MGGREQRAASARVTAMECAQQATCRAHSSPRCDGARPRRAVGLSPSPSPEPEPQRPARALLALARAALARTARRAASHLRLRPAARCGPRPAACRGPARCLLPAASCPLPAADRGAPSCPLNPPMLPAQAPALPACCCRRSQLPPPLPPQPPLPLPPPHPPRLAVVARSSRIPRRAPSRRAQTCSRAGSSAPSAQGKRRREGRGAEGCREQGHRRTKREFG